MHDMAWLLSHQDRRKRVQTFSFETLSLNDSSSVPWPIVYVLARFSKKYIFFTGALPKTQMLSRDLVNFDAKQRFKHTLRHSDRPRPDYKVPGPDLMLDPEAAPEIKLWTANIKNTIMDTVSYCRETASSAPKFRNQIPLVKLGLKLIRDGEWVPIQNDKDSAYTLVRNSDLGKITLAQLNKPIYKLVELRNDDITMWSDHAKNLAGKIAKASSDTYLKSYLSRSLNRRRATAVAELQIKCKSHKQPGEVGFRFISATSAYKYAGLSLWLAKQCRIILQQYDTRHMVQSSQCFAKAWVGTRVNLNSVLIKLDIKDFS